MANKTLRLLLVLTVALAMFSVPSFAQASGCPEGLWTNMSAELTSACAGDLAGTVVTMTGPFTDEDEVKFNASVEEFEGWTGIDIQYTGTKEFETIITAAVQGGAAPDIADFPQ